MLSWLIGKTILDHRALADEPSCKGSTDRRSCTAKLAVHSHDFRSAQHPALITSQQVVVAEL